VLPLLDDKFAYDGRFVPRGEHVSERPLSPMYVQILLHTVWQLNAGVSGLEPGPDVLLEPLDCLGMVFTRRSSQSLDRGVKTSEIVP
jgi:hypothetical protein